jgi:predicted DNA-binding transcriptional regulator AlpA
MDGINQDILNERQVAEWLGLSAPTLNRHRRDGTGPTFIRLSERRVAYRRSAVEAWLKEREQRRVDNDGVLNPPAPAVTDATSRAMSRGDEQRADQKSSEKDRKYAA